MSRIGKLPILLPKNTSCSILPEGLLEIKSGNIKKTYYVGSSANVTVSNDSILVAAKAEQENSSAYWGLHRNNLKNIVNGLNTPFSITLEINGVGYKSSVDKNILSLTLGYSHDISYAIPKDVTIKCEKPTVIVISGSDKDLVGTVAAEIISFRKVEPYKGKGVFIKGQYIRRKEGKKK